MLNSLLANARLRAANFKRRLAARLPNIHQIGHIYHSPDGMFALPATDTSFATILRKGVSHGAEEVGRITSLAPPGRPMLVVGGHIGTLAIPLSLHASDVTVIEANPGTFKFLAANVALNGRDNIELIELAAGERKGTIEFVASNANTGGSKRRPKISDARYFYDSPKLVTVAMDALDDILEPRYQTIVMDIEGSEYFALTGMKRILGAADLLFVEFIAHHLVNVSGVTADEFHAAVGHDFGYLLVPSTGVRYEGAAVRAALNEMIANDCSEEVIVFAKAPFPA